MKRVVSKEVLMKVLNEYTEDTDLFTIEDFQYILEEYGRYVTFEGWCD